MRRPARGLLLIALALPFQAPAPLRAEPPAAPAPAPPLQAPRDTRERMEAALQGTPSFRIVFGTRDPAWTTKLRERATAFAGRFGAGDTTVVIADRDAGAADLAGRSILLLGGPRENEWTARLAAALPVSFVAQGFRWQGTDYDRPGDALNLVWPNPLDPGRFLLLVAANSREALAGRGGRLLFGEEDWRIYRDGELVRFGEFAQDAGQPWRYDPALDRDLVAMREQARRAMRGIGTGPVRVLSAPGTREAAAVLGAAEALLLRLDRMGFAARRPAAITLTLHPSLEAKGALTRNTRPEHLEGAAAAQLAIAAGRHTPDLWSVAGLRLCSLGARPDSPWLTPASVWLCGRFDGEPLDQAIKRLYFGRLLPRAPDAAASAAPDSGESEARWRSPLVWEPARALLVRAIFEAGGPHGANAVLALLRGPAPRTLASVCRSAGVPDEAVARRYAALADSIARRAGGAAEPPRSWRPADGFQAGVCLAHTVGLEHGYLSAECGAELARLQRMGARWISLTPIGYLPSLDSPVLEPATDSGPDGESDEAVCEAMARARALGMRVWLVPRLWARGFPGELRLDPPGWTRFFERYRAFVLHYALLAQREGADGLVIGHELTSAALGHPDAWRALIADVRRVYDGTLTYAASWNEVRDVSFWGALDLIGVSFYTPLATRPTHDVAALTAGARKGLAELKTIAEREGRPVLMVEAGYAPQPAAAVRPWEEARGEIDLEAQRACYQALVSALERETWIAGVFWWNWPSGSESGGESGGARDGSHTPRGKSAEQVMRQALAAWQGRPVSVPRNPADRRAPAPP